MKLTLIARLGLAAAIVLLLAACSSDPAVRKVKYLNSGEKYFAKGNYRAAEVEFRNCPRARSAVRAGALSSRRNVHKAGRLRSARRELQTSVDLNPQNSEAR